MKKARLVSQQEGTEKVERTIEKGRKKKKEETKE